jgi:hypothetical protein
MATRFAEAEGLELIAELVEVETERSGLEHRPAEPDQDHPEQERQDESFRH